MSTHEPELREPVDLALPDGYTLNPAARGWSRRPLHRANLQGVWGRTKRWDYWAILAGDLVVSSVYADVDYLGLADVWWVDLTTAVHGGRGISVPGARGFSLPDVPATAPLRVARRNFELDISDAPDGATHLVASWRERDGRRGRLDATVELPDAHESLNVVIPWTDRRFQFTSKHQARPAHGELVVGDRTWTFGAARGGTDAWGVLDVGRGRWPYRTRWNWGGGAGRVRGGASVVGLQLGGKWTVGTGFTENGVLLDGVLTKLGAELVWDYDWDEPLRPWTVQDPGGQLSLVLHPRYDKHSKTEIGIMGTETHQVFGTWSGVVVTDAGERVELAEIQGFAEESRSRW
ncbi:MAG TPA: DUF2804 domain-containing protein [Acidimicrobiia bacterium]|nr:DUF2804 domain-containing protein [Acidimicrobiia bacterium]